MENYSSFYRTHKDRLFRYLVRLSGDYQLASDLMQESFTRCLEHYGGNSFKPALLYSIARNAFLDHTRKKAPGQTGSEPADGSAPDPERQLLIREEYRQVLSAMEQLEKSERDVLAMTVSSRMRYREIAAVTGLSEANVKVKVHRARVKLRKILRTMKNDD